MLRNFNHKAALAVLKNLANPSTMAPFLANLYAYLRLCCQLDGECRRLLTSGQRKELRIDAHSGALSPDQIPWSNVQQTLRGLTPGTPDSFLTLQTCLEHLDRFFPCDTAAAVFLIPKDRQCRVRPPMDIGHGYVYVTRRGPRTFKDLYQIRAEENPEKAFRHFLEDPGDHMENLSFTFLEEESNLEILSFYEAFPKPRSRHLIVKAAKQLHNGSCKIGCFSLKGDFHTCFEHIQQPNSTALEFRASNIAGRKAYEDRITAVIQCAIKEKTDIVILPELTVDQEGRKLIARLLREGFNRDNPSVKMVVAGSYHVCVSEADAQFVNRCVVFDGYGEELPWRHDKMIPYKMRASDAQKLSLFPNFPAGIPPQTELWEGITPGSQLQLVDTPLGRIGIMICVDFLSEQADLCHRLAIDARCDLLFVPSMTYQTADFENAARTFSRNALAASFIANAACILSAPGKIQTEWGAHFLLPLPNLDGGRRNKGYRYLHEEGARNRKNVLANPEPMGSLLREEGLICDLGGYWQEVDQ